MKVVIEVELPSPKITVEGERKHLEQLEEELRKIRDLAEFNEDKFPILYELYQSLPERM